MLTYENELWSKGMKLIAGIDEVGRGCLCGDVVAACVILRPYDKIEGINDSKKLSPKKREELYEIIEDKALAIGIGRVNAKVIDEINIKQATRIAMLYALNALELEPEYLLIDAERIDSNIEQMSIIKGDSLSQSIAAASIIAKVTRDRDCEKWDELYPKYGIKQHKGYGTKVHREMLQKYGATEIHRQTFLGKIL